MSRVGIFKEIQFIYLLRQPLDPQIGSDMTTQHELLLQGIKKLLEEVEKSKLLVKIDLKMKFSMLKLTFIVVKTKDLRYDYINMCIVFETNKIITKGFYSLSNTTIYS